MKKTTIIISLLSFLIPAVSMASIDVNIGYGSRGNAVIELQEFLIDKGLLTGQATGNFFTLTKKAVIAYQGSTGLPTTGFVGNATREKINLELLDNTPVVADETIPATRPAIDEVIAAIQRQIDALVLQLRSMRTTAPEPLPILSVTPPQPQIQPQQVTLGSVASTTPSKIEISSRSGGFGGPGLYCTNTIVRVRAFDQNGAELIGQTVDVLNTYSSSTKSGLTPFDADFGWNDMREAEFQLRATSGSLTAIQNIRVYEPNLERSGVATIKQGDDVVCAH